MNVDPYIRPQEHADSTSVTETDKVEYIIDRVFLVDGNGNVVATYCPDHEVDIFVFKQEDGKITVPDGFVVQAFPEVQKLLDGNLDCRISLGIREERFKVDIRSPNKTKLAKVAKKQQKRAANKLAAIQLSPLAQALLKGK